jgi:hypothetical protein
MHVKVAGSRSPATETNPALDGINALIICSFARLYYRMTMKLLQCLLALSVLAAAGADQSLENVKSLQRLGHLHLRAERSRNHDRSSNQRQLDDVVNAITSNITGELNVSAYAASFGYINETDFCHDVVTLILGAIGYPVNFTGVELLDFGDAPSDAPSAIGIPSDTPTAIGNPSDAPSNIDIESDAPTSESISNDDGPLYGYAGSDDDEYDGSNDFCGGPGDDCAYAYNDYHGFNGIKGVTIETLLQDMGVVPSVNASLVELNCPVSNADEPPCAFDWNGDIGSWVCRTMYHPVTGEPIEWNACVDPGKKGLSTDTCGCCGGSCPEVCPCSCELVNGSGAGSLVRVRESDFFSFSTWASSDEYNWFQGEATLCLHTEIAVSLVSRPGGETTCLSDCSIVY